MSNVSNVNTFGIFWKYLAINGLCHDYNNLELWLFCRESGGGTNLALIFQCHAPEILILRRSNIDEDNRSVLPPAISRFLTQF